MALYSETERGTRGGHSGAQCLDQKVVCHKNEVRNQISKSLTSSHPHNGCQAIMLIAFSASYFFPSCLKAAVCRNTPSDHMKGAYLKKVHVSAPGERQQNLVGKTCQTVPAH